LLTLSNMPASLTTPLPLPFLKQTAHLLQQSMSPVIKRPKRERKVMHTEKPQFIASLSTLTINGNSVTVVFVYIDK
jgi:hypothetical protein